MLIKTPKSYTSCDKVNNCSKCGGKFLLPELYQTFVCVGCDKPTVREFSGPEICGKVQLNPLDTKVTFAKAVADIYRHLDGTKLVVHGWEEDGKLEIRFLEGGNPEDFPIPAGNPSDFHVSKDAQDFSPLSLEELPLPPVPDFEGNWENQQQVELDVGAYFIDHSYHYDNVDDIVTFHLPETPFTDGVVKAFITSRVSLRIMKDSALNDLDNQRQYHLMMGCSKLLDQEAAFYGGTNNNNVLGYLTKMVETIMFVHQHTTNKKKISLPNIQDMVNAILCLDFHRLEDYEEVLPFVIQRRQLEIPEDMEELVDKLYIVASTIGNYPEERPMFNDEERKIYRTVDYLNLCAEYSGKAPMKTRDFSNPVTYAGLLRGIYEKVAVTGTYQHLKRQHEEKLKFKHPFIFDNPMWFVEKKKVCCSPMVAVNALVMKIFKEGPGDKGRNGKLAKDLGAAFGFPTKLDSTLPTITSSLCLFLSANTFCLSSSSRCCFLS